MAHSHHTILEQSGYHKTLLTTHDSPQRLHLLLFPLTHLALLLKLPPTPNPLIPRLLPIQLMLPLSLPLRHLLLRLLCSLPSSCICAFICRFLRSSISANTHLTFSFHAFIKLVSGSLTSSESTVSFSSRISSMRASAIASSRMARFFSSSRPW